MVTTICPGQKSELSFFTRLNYLNLPEHSPTAAHQPRHSVCGPVWSSQVQCFKYLYSQILAALCATDIRNIVVYVDVYVFPPSQCHFVAIPPRLVIFRV